MFNKNSKKTRFDIFLEFYYKNIIGKKKKKINFSPRDTLEF